MKLILGAERPILTLTDLEAFDQYAPAGGAERRFCCPLCGDGKAVDPSHRSLSLQIETGKWNCHRCGQGGILREHWQPRNNTTRLATARRAIAGNTPPATSRPGLEAHGDLLAGLVPLAGSPGAAYLQDRGIPLALAEESGITFHPALYGRPGVLFPVRDGAGQIVGFLSRHTDTRTDPKAHDIGAKSAGVFATPGAREAAVLVVTEAPIDALSLAACGVPAVALGGCAWPAWLPGACVFRRVALAFDADDAGDAAADKLRPLLESFGAKVERWRPDGHKDWNEALAAGFLTPQLLELGIDPPVAPSGANASETHEDGQGIPVPTENETEWRASDPLDLPFDSFDTAGTFFGPTDPDDGGNTRHASPCSCWQPGCNAVAPGPWQRIGPDCWQAACASGHVIQRTAASFDLAESERGQPARLPASLPPDPLPLWLYDRVHGITSPSPAPEHLMDEQIAAEVEAATAAFERLVRPASYRRHVKPPEVRPPELVDAILDAGYRLGWPALQPRPGERLAAGEACWRAFVRAATVDRLRDTDRALQEGNGH